jgi:hypothetical protein
MDVSPDGRWLVAWSPLGDGGMAPQALALDGGPAVQIAGMIGVWRWSPVGDAVSFSGGPVAEGRSYIIPVPPGSNLPKLPAAGLHSEEDVAGLPGAQRVDAQGVVPGPSRDVYAFYRGTTHRNVYRVPIP